jgi:hypothetical protein
MNLKFYTFIFPHGQEILLSSTTPRPDLELMQPPIQRATGVSSPCLNRPGHETDNSLPSSTEILTYLHTYGAEPFLRNRQLCSHSRNSEHFMEPEGSSPCSQEPSTGPYSEPD